MLLDLLVPQAGERVLDLGCGTGSLLRELVKCGCQVTGVDRDAVVLEQARINAPEAELVCAEAASFAPPQAFDAVAAAGVLHWMEPLDAGALILARMLRPGGRAAGCCGGAGAAPVEAALLRSALRRAGFVEVEVEESADRIWFFAVLGDVSDVA